MGLAENLALLVISPGYKGAMPFLLLLAILVMRPQGIFAYLAGGAVGNAAPTPGGLGAVEAAISTGLAAAGMPGASAVSAVLLFRLATFWIPVPLGWLAYVWMQRRNWL